MKISLSSFAFLFISVSFYFSLAANTSDLPWNTADLERAYKQLISSVETKLTVAKAYVTNLKHPKESPSTDLPCHEEFSDENPSYYVEVLEDCLNLLSLCRCHNNEEVEKFESEIRSVIFDLIEYVSYWFKEDPEMLLEFVTQNPNLSLNNLYELAKRCTSSDELLRFPLRMYLLVADLTKKVVWDLGDKRDQAKKFNSYDPELRTRLHSLIGVLKGARDHFFPKIAEFSERLEETFIFKLEKFSSEPTGPQKMSILMGYEPSNFENWYRDITGISSRLDKFCFEAEQSSDFEIWYLDFTGLSSRISSDIALEPLENSIKKLTNCLEFLKKKILLSPLPFNEISLFFGIFYDSISKVNLFVTTRGYNSKIEDIKNTLKKLLIEFDGKILSPLYHKDKPGLLTFLLESKVPKLAHFVIMLLNQEDSRRYYKCIEYNEVNSEYSYCSEYSLKNDLGEVKSWDPEARKVYSMVFKISKPLPDVRPKGCPTYWLSEYILFLKNSQDIINPQEKEERLKNSLDIINPQEKEESLASDIALDLLEKSIEKLTNCLEFLKTKNLHLPSLSTEIRLFFGFFDDSISQVNSFITKRGFNYKIGDIKNSLEKLLIEFEGKILSPLFRKNRLGFLCYFLKPKELKLAQFVILLLNQKDSRRYFKCIENNEVNSEYIYCSPHSLIDDLGEEKGWHYVAREIASKFVKILEALPDVHPKGYCELSKYVRFLKNRLMNHDPLDISDFDYSTL